MKMTKWLNVVASERKVFVFALAFLVSLFPAVASAAPGDLDTTFNSPNGFALFDRAANRDWGNDLAVQPDGKIVVIGGCTSVLGNADVLVIRYNSDGTLDTTFGTAGFVTYNGPGGGIDAAWGLSIQPDGKIVVVGEHFAGATGDLLVLRFNSDGTLDSTFAAGGVFSYNGSGNDRDSARGVVIQPDGKIVVAGGSSNGTNLDVLILRLNNDGTLDDSFGTGGVVTYNGPGNDDDYAWGVTLRPNGKIMVVGTRFADDRSEVLLLGYHTDGTLDPYIGTGGVITYAPPDGSAQGYTVAFTASGGGIRDIIVGGTASSGGQNDLLVLRYREEGVGRASLDPNFGTGGVFTYSGSAGGEDTAIGIAIQKDGDIVAVGRSHNGSNYDVVVLRLKPDGTLDPEFGTGGVVIFKTSADGIDIATGIALEKDGKIVISGESHNGANQDALVFRLLGDEFRTWRSENVSFNLKVTEPFESKPGQWKFRTENVAFSGSAVLECTDDVCTGSFTSSALGGPFFNFTKIQSISTIDPKKSTERMMFVGVGEHGLGGVNSPPGVAFLEAEGTYHKDEGFIILKGKMEGARQDVDHFDIVSGSFSNMKLE